MTKEDVIEHLRELKTLKIEFSNTLQEQALDIAIHALETGEVYMNGKDYNLYLEGYKQGKKDFERPQGEWKLVERDNQDIDVVCPFCSKTRIFSYAHGYSIEEVKSQLQEVNDLPNYCENCGAKMKGGKE